MDFDRFTTKVLINEVFINSAGHNLVKQSFLTTQMCKKKKKKKIVIDTVQA